MAATSILARMSNTPKSSEPAVDVHSDSVSHGTVSVARGYNAKIKEHFFRPCNVGQFNQNDPDVGSASVGTTDQGAVIKIQIRVDESGIINSICFKAYGCGATIAAASWATEWAKGKSLDQVSELRSAQLIQALELPTLKTHCAMLAEDAIKSAVDHYRQRQESP